MCSKLIRSHHRSSIILEGAIGIAAQDFNKSRSFQKSGTSLNFVKSLERCSTSGERLQLLQLPFLMKATQCPETRRPALLYCAEGRAFV